jgi:ribose/xylose/arabinose/galactoside ABC-type transport system permease subunit
MATLVVSGQPIWLAVLVSVLIGAVFGVINGTLVSYIELPPFIVTLATFGIAQSLATVVTEGNSVTGLPDAVAGNRQDRAACSAVRNGGVRLRSLSHGSSLVFAIGGNRGRWCCRAATPASTRCWCTSPLGC